MFRLIYSSQASDQFAETDLAAILDASRRNNPEDGVTGLLVYSDAAFLQVLEGDKDRVTACFDRISRDPRHDSCKILHTQDVSRRSFPDWSMGYRTATEIPELAALVGAATSGNALQRDTSGMPLVVRKFVRGFCDLHMT